MGAYPASESSDCKLIIKFRLAVLNPLWHRLCFRLFFYITLNWNKKKEKKWNEYIFPVVHWVHCSATREVIHYSQLLKTWQEVPRYSQTHSIQDQIKCLIHRDASSDGHLAPWRLIDHSDRFNLTSCSSYRWFPFSWVLDCKKLHCKQVENELRLKRKAWILSRPYFFSSLSTHSQTLWELAAKLTVRCQQGSSSLSVSDSEITRTRCESLASTHT